MMPATTHVKTLCFKIDPEARHGPGLLVHRYALRWVNMVFHCMNGNDYEMKSVSLSMILTMIP
jgi:hypothetical protein